MGFHAGEIFVQTRALVRAEAEKLEPGLKSVIPSKAHKLLSEQPLAIASTVDEVGNVWASLLTGKAGFIKVEDEQIFLLDTSLIAEERFYQNLGHNGILGLLIIDLANRKRLRINGQAQLNLNNQIQLQGEHSGLLLSVF